MRVVLSILLLLVSLSLFSRSVDNDTIPYKVERYEVKKQMKVSELALKLKVDAAIIVKLNKFRSVNSIVVKGQRVKVPVYPKPEKKAAEKKPKESKAEERKSAPQKKETKPSTKDSEKKKEEPKADKKPAEVKKEEPKKEKKEPEAKPKEAKAEKKKEEPAKAADTRKSKKKSKDKNEEVQITAAPLPPVSAKPDSNIAEEEPLLKTAEFEKGQVRLIMIDAILELNEAMMEGVRASLDSLDVGSGSSKENSRFAKDREKLIPYILHIQDSLSREISALKAEKEEIEARIFPPKIYTDTVVSGDDIVVYEVTNYSGRKEEERKVLKVITKVTEKAKPAVSAINTKEKKPVTPAVRDTLLVYDLASPSPANKGGGKKVAPKDTVTAVSRPVKTKADTTATIKIKLPNSQDTMVIKPIAKPATTTSVSSSRPTTTRPLSAADSIKRIKAQFFLKRAQKALGEKNYKSAQEYLEKSIELYPKYFDACYELGQMYDKKGDYREALKAYQSCTKLDSSQPKLFFSIGNAYLKQKQKTEAMHYYTKALAIKGDDIPTLMARASIFTDWKNYKGAIIDYDQVLKTDRLYHYAYKARGQVKLLTKEFASAMDDFTRFLIFEESDPSAYYYRGLAKIANNDLLEGCMDLSTSASMGYAAAEKAIKKSCE